MRRKIVLIFGLLFIIVNLTACANNSEYEKLAKSEQNIVDNILSNAYLFADCNMVKFDEYNGEMYFVVSKIEYANNQTSLGAVGHASEVRYYIANDSAFEEVEYDPYIGQTAYGSGTYKWDGSLSEEEKREILAVAIG